MPLYVMGNSIQFNSLFINVLNSTANGQLQSQQDTNNNNKTTEDKTNKQTKGNIKKSKSSKAN
jgi:hypothetical protein